MTEQTRAKLQLLALVAAMSVGVPVSHAQTASDASVRGVIAVGGTAPEDQRAAAGEAVRAALTSAGWTIPELPLPKVDSDRMINCATPAEPWRCVPGKLGQQQIARAMLVSVEPKSTATGPMVAVTETAVSTTKNVFVVLQRPCEQCTTDKLKETARTLATDLVKLLASRAGDTAIEVVSDPADAEVTLDGQKAAATGNTFTTFPGEHVIVISKAGYADEPRTVQLKEGQTVRVSVTLRASVGEVRHVSRVVPIAAFAVGGVGLVGAGILIYLGQQNGPDDRTEHRRATALGIASGIAGLAAIGAGVYLWHRGTATGGPTVGLTNAGTPVLGWTRTF